MVSSGRADKAVIGGGIPTDSLSTTRFNDEILTLNQNIAYRLSVIPAIWSKKYFMKYLQPNMTIWDFEAHPSPMKAAYDGATIINYDSGPNPESPRLFCFVNAYQNGELSIKKDLTFTCNMPQRRHYSKESLQYIRDNILEDKRKFEKRLSPEKIYSKKDKDKLIFSLFRFSEITERRTDLSPDEEILQVCGRKMNQGVFVPAHRHLETNRNTNLTQEAWVLLKGKVKAIFYDLDDSYLCKRIINSGDVVVLYRGGHALEVLEDDTIFYEFKNGPYHGVEKDKEKINE
jgi:hypothetical protein